MRSSLGARQVDLLLGAGVALVLTILVTSGQTMGGPVDPLAYLWALALGLLMLVRRSHPVLVLALTTVGFFSYYAAGFPAMGVAVPIAAALFSAAEMGHTRAAVVTGLGTLAGATAYRVANYQDLAYVLGYELLTHVTLIAAVIALGHSVRVGRQLRRRRDQVSRLLARQRLMDQDARMREDRLSLARDLHDSIGHSLTLAALYAGLARDEHASEAQQDESLAMVRSAVSEALSHLRRTVRVLRTGTGPMAAPGLEDLPRLMRAPSAAGYDVHLDVTDVRLPDDVGAAVYRLVQEGVTNVLRHSTGRRIEVSVGESSPGVLDVGVADDGWNDEEPRLEPGHGLSGMRERVADLGGDLSVDADRSGWRIRASIPLGEHMMEETA